MYKGKEVPPFLEEDKPMALIFLFDGCSNVCYLVSCASVMCSTCFYNGGGLHNGSLPTLDWYIKNGYFTKAEVLEANLKYGSKDD